MTRQPSKLTQPCSVWVNLTWRNQWCWFMQNKQREIFRKYMKTLTLADNVCSMQSAWASCGSSAVLYLLWILPLGYATHLYLQCDSFQHSQEWRNDGWFEVLSHKTLAPIHPKRAHAFGGTWSVMGPCRILPNHKRCTAFLTSPGEARKAFSFPLRHGMTWPSQNTITHVIQFLRVARLCFHCHLSKLNFCRAQVPTLREHTWYWFISVAGTPPPTPFRLSPPVPGVLLH